MVSLTDLPVWAITGVFTFFEICKKKAIKHGGYFHIFKFKERDTRLRNPGTLKPPTSHQPFHQKGCQSRGFSTVNGTNHRHNQSEWLPLCYIATG